jgi:hypothetical protein
VKEPSLLLAMNRVIGGVEIQHDFLRLSGVGLEKDGSLRTSVETTRYCSRGAPVRICENGGIKT